MSRRRRPYKDSPLGLPVSVHQGLVHKRVLGVKPIDRCASVDVIDGRGHRLARFHRMLGAECNTTDDALIWRPVGKGVDFGASPPDADWWDTMWFICQACWDNGDPDLSHVDLNQVRLLVNQLWNEGRAKGTPRRAQMRSTDAPDW